ncbi:MAG: hypothetical protein ACE5I8_01010 [Thermodesulfobacteriota bacterium]
MLKRSIVETKRLIEVASGRRSADYYLANGRIIAKKGKLTVDPSPLPAIGLGDRPFTLGKTDENLFRVPCRKRARIRVPVIHIVDKTVTERRDAELTVRDGAIQAASSRDILKIFLIERKRNQSGCGFHKCFLTSTDIN